MTDTYAGAKVRATDYPPTVQSHSDTSVLNITDVAFVEGAPNVRVTFTAPKSGRVLVIVGGGLRDSSGVDQVFIHPEIRETDVSGAVVVTPSVTGRYLLASPPQAVNYYYASTAAILEGLTPGGTYFARVMHRVTSPANGTADIAARGLIVQPIP